jgi:hypothetical protein
MSGTFPSSPKASSISINSQQNTIISTTTSGRRQARQIDGQRFGIRVNFPTMSRSEFAPIIAFIMKQRSQLESFNYVVPTVSTLQGSASTVISTTGSHAAGVTSINLTGMTASQSGIFKAGDFIRFTGQNKVYMVISDVSSNGSGVGTMTIEPPLRSSLSTGTVLIYSNVDFTVGLISDVQEFNVGTENLFNYQVDLIEVL